MIKFSNTQPQNQTLSEHCSSHAFAAKQHPLNTHLPSGPLHCHSKVFEPPLNVNFVPALTKSTVLLSCQTIATHTLNLFPSTLNNNQEDLWLGLG